MTFNTLELHPLLLKSIEKSGYNSPTPIQSQAIPCVLKGSDLLASAQTGTGKTAAFVLPILHKLATSNSAKKGNGPRALILTPTRELAQQISEAARKYAQFIERASVVTIVGGVPYDRQRQKLRKPIDILVATPGRLIDYLGQKAIDFSRVETLVLDEADRMLDMGFVDAVREIAEVLPKQRQTLLFSATLDKSVTELAGDLLNDPVRVTVTPEKTKHELIEQSVQFVATQHEKNSTLATLLQTESFAKAIVFVATKRSADDISYKLNKQGLRTSALHGDMRQGARNRTVRELTSNEVNIVVATDVAARGLDVKDVELIINYDLPRQSEDYVHRIGRTGRAGAKGKAISLAYNKEKKLVTTLERYLGHPLTKSFSEASKVEEAEFKTNGPREGNGSRGRRSGGRDFGPRRGGKFGSRSRDDAGGEKRSFGKFKRKFDRPFKKAEDTSATVRETETTPTTGEEGFKKPTRRFEGRGARGEQRSERRGGFKPRFGGDGFKKKFSGFKDRSERSERRAAQEGQSSEFKQKPRFDSEARPSFEKKEGERRPQGRGGFKPRFGGGGFKKKFGGFKPKRFGGQSEGSSSERPSSDRPFKKFRRGSGRSFGAKRKFETQE